MFACARVCTRVRVYDTRVYACVRVYARVRSLVLSASLACMGVCARTSRLSRGARLACPRLGVRDLQHHAAGQGDEHRGGAPRQRRHAQRARARRVRRRGARRARHHQAVEGEGAGRRRREGRAVRGLDGILACVCVL